MSDKAIQKIAEQAAQSYIYKLDLPKSVRTQAVQDLTLIIKSAIYKAIAVEREKSRVLGELVEGLRAELPQENPLMKQMSDSVEHIVSGVKSRLAPATASEEKAFQIGNEIGRTDGMIDGI